MSAQTELIPYSVGLVIEDTIDNSWWLRAIPIEKQGFIDGEIKDLANSETVKGVDSQGNSWETSYQTTNAVSAKWYSGDSNRRTPPNIHKGEKVQLLRYGDSEEFFWTDIGQDSKNRTTERVVQAWSNKPERDGKELDNTNSYYFEVDTENGLITLKTNKNNGEPFEYTVQLNTKDGTVVIEDDTDNAIYIESSKKEVGMENTSGCFIRLKDKDIEISAVNNINITAGNELKGTAPKINWNASTSYKISTNTYNLSSSKADITASGGYSVTSGSMTHNGVNVGATHSHMEQGDGKPVGPPQ